jgi:hypothetical protein
MIQLVRCWFCGNLATSGPNPTGLYAYDAHSHFLNEDPAASTVSAFCVRPAWAFTPTAPNRTGSNPETHPGTEAPPPATPIQES